MDRLFWQAVKGRKPFLESVKSVWRVLAVEKSWTLFFSYKFFAGRCPPGHRLLGEEESAEDVSLFILPVSVSTLPLRPTCIGYFSASVYGVGFTEYNVSDLGWHNHCSSVVSRYHEREITPEVERPFSFGELAVGC
jgi:hypothetical protein